MCRTMRRDEGKSLGRFPGIAVIIILILLKFANARHAAAANAGKIAAMEGSRVCHGRSVMKPRWVRDEEFSLLPTRVTMALCCW